LITVRAGLCRVRQGATAGSLTMGLSLNGALDEHFKDDETFDVYPET
jgi:hypothetical protein